ncbi:LLM class flavin-dependent oxidoreductase [Cohnella sp. AR92]|uniref:LLM class flavin-dependent oxidoreductase n=1 Tax=Cohnella sp. AR92 TaxID=648716 RepID=UPI000F8D6419|nr:LLM class flavin-dependent oxidoreductase [Cohnella sp. AR92]RUS48535.1 LLM class flavin-dependent oxidoreductase [Cohnella sp. AR92]
MNGRRRQMRLGALLHGVGGGYGGWRHPEMPADASIDIQAYARQAKKAEEGKMDFVFVADVLHIHERSTPHFLNHLEPVTLLAALAPVTERIGLVGTLSTTYNEPSATARQLGSLQRLSGERAGWNAVTTGMAGAAANFGRAGRPPEHPEHGERYRLAGEFMRAARRCWTEDGTAHPVVFQAGSSEDGIAFAALHADAVMTAYRPLEEAKRLYEAIHTRTGELGRTDGGPLVFPAVNVTIAPTREEAVRKRERLDALVGLEHALRYLAQFFDDHDFTVYPPDAPFPDLGDLGRKSYQSATDRIKREARELRLTLRQAAYRWMSPPTPFVGTPEAIADALQIYFESGAADGFVVGGDDPNSLSDFVELVLPILRSRGLFRADYETDTLRSHLGLTEARAEARVEDEGENAAVEEAEGAFGRLAEPGNSLGRDEEMRER